MALGVTYTARFGKTLRAREALQGGTAKPLQAPRLYYRNANESEWWGQQIKRLTALLVARLDVRGARPADPQCGGKLPPGDAKIVQTPFVGNWALLAAEKHVSTN